MVNHRTRNTVFVVFAVVIVGSMIFFIQQSTFEEFEAILPPPAQLFTSEELRGFAPLDIPLGAIPIDNIECKIKQRLQVFDLLGNLLFQTDSVGLAGSPFIPALLTDPSNLGVVSFYKMSLLAFCAQEGGGTTVVLPSGFVVRVQGTLVDGSLGASSYYILSSKRVEFSSGVGETALLEHTIFQNDIDNKFSLADYNSDITFSMYGTLDIAYEGFETFTYEFPILESDIRTQYTGFVQNAPAPPEPVPVDTDGDGIIDTADACPTLKEDGFGDMPSDGCPIPFVLPPPEPEPEPPADTCESTNDLALCRQQCTDSGKTWYADQSTRFCGQAIITDDNLLCEVFDPSQNICINPFRPDDATPVTTEEFLSGMIRLVGSTVYKDLSQDTFVIQEGIFFSSIGQIQPLTVSTVISGQEREIERIEVEVYYIYPNTADAFATTLEDSDLNFRPAVRITGTEQRLGTPFIGTAGDVGETGSQQIPFGTGTGIGNGFLLSSKAFLARDIQALGTAVNPTTGDPLIGEGNSAEVTFQVDVTGDFTLSREATTADFLINDAFVLFSDITINNLKGLLKDTPCLGNQVPIRDVDGQQIGCTDPPEGDRDADGVSDVADDCPDVFGTVSNSGCPAPDAKPSPDTDGDGIPDNIDPDIDGDGIPNTTDTDDDGDGIPDTEEKPPCEQIEIIGIEVICVKGVIITTGDNGEVCSVAEPQNCPIPVVPFDLNTLLVIGGVGFLIIGVTVIVLRRR